MQLITSYLISNYFDNSRFKIDVLSFDSWKVRTVVHWEECLSLSNVWHVNLCDVSLPKDKHQKPNDNKQPS